jgi:hypothetical protein
MLNDTVAPIAVMWTHPCEKHIIQEVIHSVYVSLHDVLDVCNGLPFVRFLRALYWSEDRPLCTKPIAIFDSEDCSAYPYLKFHGISPL